MEYHENNRWTQAILSLRIMEDHAWKKCVEAYEETLQKGENLSLPEWLIREKHISGEQLSSIEEYCQVSEKTMVTNDSESFSVGKTHIVARDGQRLVSDAKEAGAKENDKVMGSRAATLRMQPKIQSRSLERIGRYQIIKEIGQGGMGKVYLAYDTELQREVAIKVLLSGAFAGSVEIERFLREARAMARLHHPNIVSIHDIGHEDGHHFFAMDFVEGISLKTFLQNNAPGIHVTLAILSKIGNAIHYAHSQGIIHRDLKPANVMMDQKGEPKVMDFGLAKISYSDDGISQSGMIVGTLLYMSPEQAEGNTRGIDARTDIYSMGAILYEMLSCRPVFRMQESFPKMLQAILTQSPEPIQKFKPDVPSDIEKICFKALQKKKEDRYASAEEFVQDICRFRQGEKVRISLPRKSFKFRLKKSLVIAFALVLTCAMCFYATIYFTEPELKILLPGELQKQSHWEVPSSKWEIVMEGEFKNVPSHSKILLGQHFEPRQTTREIRKNPKTGRFSAEIELEYGVNAVGIYIWKQDASGGPGHLCKAWSWKIVRKAPEQETVAFGGIRRAGVYPGKGVSQAKELKWKFATNRGIDTTPVVMDEILYFGSRDKHFYAVNTETGRLKWKFATEGMIFSSPAIHEETVYFGSDDGNLYALDASTGQEKWRFPSEKMFRASPAVAGQCVYVGSCDHRFYALDASTGQPCWKYDTEGPINCAALIEDEIVYFAGEDGYLYALEMKKGGLKWKTQMESTSLRAPSMADGVIYLAAFQSLYAVDAKDGKIRWKFDAESVIYSGVAIENGIVYFGTSHRTFRDRCCLYAVDTKTSSLLWKFSRGGDIRTPALSNRLVYAGSKDGNLYAIQAKTGKLEWQFPTDDEIQAAPCIGDGVVYIGSWDGNLYAIK